MNQYVLVFLVLSFMGSGQTLLTHRPEEVGIDLAKNFQSSKSSSKVPMEASTAYVCLEISASLPSCNFDKVDYSLNDEDIAGLSLSKSTINKREAKPHRTREDSFVIIYKLEGCLPSRLPFRLPLCKPSETFSRTAEVRRLYPFRTQSAPETAPYIFPEIDHNQWLRLMKNMGHHPESSTGEKRNLGFEAEDAKEERARPNRESESVNPIKRKSKTLKKYLTNKIHRQDIWSQFQDKEPHQNMEFFEFHPVMREDVQNTLFNAEKKIEEDAEQIRDLSQELDQLVSEVEFPYSRAIPYDPAKLQVAREGSEFPYSKAIPFDARKLEVARERSGLPFMPFRPNPNELSFEDNFPYQRRSHHSRRLQSLGKDQEIFFDSSMLKAAKQGSIFPYSKEVPRDTSKKIQKIKNHEREKKTRVPLREIDNHQTSNRDRFRRFAEGSKKLGSWINHLSRTLKTIKEGSEFPYSKAIPFDPKKLRPPGHRGEAEVRKSRHQSRSLKIIQEGSEFPYTKAISFDPTKLVESRRKSELVSKVETDLISENHIFRKPLAINAGNNLSFALFLPHNRRALHHHTKDQRGNSS
ncbi:uncharacterized protein LOC117177375 [Belonocnema kinseyi]|uniref:uncharacterized protein LOC117177375 n=1 Tax=Belonocnema kinseyi TaxID=2817044 RepID=UPI00143D7C2D|nr:uncharacterized protein LOC117177375 [Belonocnema kinseyi]